MGLAAVIGVDVHIAHDAIFDDGQAPRRNTLAIEMPRTEPARQQGIVCDRQLVTERPGANQVCPERLPLADTPRVRRPHQATDQ